MLSVVAPFESHKNSTWRVELYNFVCYGHSNLWMFIFLTIFIFSLYSNTKNRNFVFVLLFCAIQIYVLRDLINRVTSLGNLGYFWKFILIFWKDKITQRSCKIFGYFFVLTFFHNFYLNKQFHKTVYCKYLKVLKVVCCRFFGLSNWVLM
jgi:hypothetical protein